MGPRRGAPGSARTAPTIWAATSRACSTERSSLPQTSRRPTTLYIVEVELPGVSKRDIDVSLSDQVLSISGERTEKERVGIIRRRVRSIGRFYYEVRLPEPVDDHGLTAKLEDGVLTVRVPKTATTKGQRVDVT